MFSNVSISPNIHAGICIVILFPTVHADCPDNNPCVCRGKDLICAKIDNVYTTSSTTYAILILRNKPTLTTLQNYALSGLKVHTIELNNLGLTATKLIKINPTK